VRSTIHVTTAVLISLATLAWDDAPICTWFELWCGKFFDLDHLTDRLSDREGERYEVQCLLGGQYEAGFPACGVDVLHLVNHAEGRHLKGLRTCIGIVFATFSDSDLVVFRSER